MLLWGFSPSQKSGLLRESIPSQNSGSPARSDHRVAIPSTLCYGLGIYSDQARAAGRARFDGQAGNRRANEYPGA